MISVFDNQRNSILLEVASEIYADNSDISKSSLYNDFFSERGYATHKIDVRAAIFEDKKRLLVQERVDQCRSMPGGWADINEIPSKMVEREVRKESGLVIKAKKRSVYMMPTITGNNWQSTMPARSFICVRNSVGN